jgi:hypothetical protein
MNQRTGAQQRNIGPGGAEGSDAHAASYTCDKAAKKCPRVDPDIKLIEPMMPQVGQTANYTIKITGLQDPSRKFKFWIKNPEVLGGILPGPSVDGVIRLGNYAPVSSATRLEFGVRDMDRCEVEVGLGSCEYITSPTTVDVGGALTINAAGGDGTVTTSPASSSKLSDSEILKLCDEAWDAKKSGDSGFFEAIPGILGGISSISSGDYVGGITGILGGAGSLIGGGDDGKPTSVSDCKKTFPYLADL